MIIIDCKQGDPVWDQNRCGKPTTSRFGEIVTSTGKISDSREGYIKELACEAVAGRSENNFTSYRMKKGSEMEEESRQVYAMTHDDLDVYQVGFVYKDERKMFGCSPDALVDPNGGFETKDAKFSIQYDRLMSGKMVTSHIPQVQGGLYVCEREWWDFQSYCSGLPELCIRNYRNEEWIKIFTEEIERFCMDLAIAIKRLREIKGG